MDLLRIAQIPDHVTRFIDSSNNLSTSMLEEDVLLDRRPVLAC